MTTVPPPRIQTQRTNALDGANEIRIGRAQLKRKVRAGQVDVRDVISETPECARSLTVFDLLCCQLRWGRIRARRVLRPLLIGEQKSLGSLTARQRGVLCEALDGTR